MAPRITLEDVSKAAGVSRSTASLVVRGSSRIPESTALKVREAMDQLGYVYNRQAANLRQSRSMTIGLIVTEIINPYFAELAMAVDQITHDAGYTIFIGYSRDLADRQHEIIASMIERQVDGLLLLPAPDTDPERLAKQVNAANVPVVLLARRFAGFDYVGSENVKGATMLGEHLSALGCRSVAFLGGRPAPSLTEREEGLRGSLERKGCELWSVDEFRSPITPEGGATAVGRLFDLGRLPDAVVAYNDIVAEGVYGEMRRRGLEPGRDIAVASFDDTRIAARQVPPMTSVAGFPQQIGTTGAEMLMERLADGNSELPTQLTLIQPQLKIRSSTATWRPRT
ncbi:substrate-binding domain-containing protein [Arthrobacter sp. KBS0703]|jgi:LacI family transcriptional regulator|uniref:LacI family DNA-binding transcriptional regulator n=1 Tax=Bacteria TaxID=2 RepID=UPI00098EA5CB|nr:LacI family DNA-binding transcriptional regulator [Arthrobacter sp. KBS0703]TSE17323.1 substrate-binding domain-containing protein [Arthrobacter sp. KBS0703]